jgi:hypothetical protein
VEKYFLNYDDPNAEKNYLTAKTYILDLQKINSSQSIHDSHRQCANSSFTNQFMVIDADAVLLDTFRMTNIYETVKDQNFVYIFSAFNPVNDLEYGHGGIKVFQKKYFTNNNSIDMSTSFGGKVKSVKLTLNIHRFNTTAFHTWRTAFRECVKLSSGIIENRNTLDDEFRLTQWCEKFNNVSYAEFAKLGALAGRDFGSTNKSNIDTLKLINNFAWLKEQYEQVAPTAP